MLDFDYDVLDFDYDVLDFDIIFFFSLSWQFSFQDMMNRVAVRNDHTGIAKKPGSTSNNKNRNSGSGSAGHVKRPGTNAAQIPSKVILVWIW